MNSKDTPMEQAAPRLAIIIPTLNEARDLPQALSSIARQRFDMRDVVVVDKYSTDGTPQIAQSFGAEVLQGGPNQGAQRNLGASTVTHDFVFFVDADMELGEGLLDEIRALIDRGECCIIIPEESTTENFWSTVRAFERSFFEGDLTIEAARVFRRDDFERLGGYDVSLLGCEDWAFAEKLYRIVPPTRTRAKILHHEGHITLRGMARKYFRYGKGFGALSRRNPLLAAQHANPLRPSIRKHLGSLLKRPDMTAGLIVLKGVTYSAGLAGFFADYIESAMRKLRQAQKQESL
jgi:glycosyltransferase involved in cell wall biosynthesis